MKDQILQSLDNVDCSIMEYDIDAMVNLGLYYQKQAMFLENCEDDDIPDYMNYIFQESDTSTKTNDSTAKSASSGKPSVLKRLLNLIKKTIAIIGKAISTLVSRIKSVFSKNHKTASQICEDVLTGDATKSKMIGRSSISAKEWSNKVSSPLKMSKPCKSSYKISKLTNKISKGDRTIELPSDERSTVDMGSIKLMANDVVVMFDQEKDSIILNIDSLDNRRVIHENGKLNMSTAPTVKGQGITHHHVYYSIVFLVMPDLFDEFESLLQLNIPDFDPSSKISIANVNNYFKKYVRDMNDFINKKYFSEMDSISHFHKFKLSMKDITEFQRRINNMSDLIGSINQTFDNEKFESLWNNPDIDLKAFNNLFATLFSMMNAIQFSFNTITGSLRNVDIIDGRYCETIKDIESLGAFVDELQACGIPSKYIAYNVWLACDEAIRGSNEYKPIWGQTRIIFFPKNMSDRVLKIAINRTGTKANQVEAMVASIVDEYGEDKNIISKTYDISTSSNVISAEKIVSSKTRVPSQIDLNNVTMIIDKALKNFETSEGKSVGNITDIHKGNVIYNPGHAKGSKYVCIDYGMLRRKA